MRDDVRGAGDRFPNKLKYIDTYNLFTYSGLLFNGIICADFVGAGLDWREHWITDTSLQTDGDCC